MRKKISIGAIFNLEFIFITSEAIDYFLDVVRDFVVCV